MEVLCGPVFHPPGHAVRGSIGPIDSRLGPQTLRYGGTQILIYYGKPSPFSRAQEVYFDFLPVRDYLDKRYLDLPSDAGADCHRTVRYVAAVQGILNPSTRFLRPVPETTLTIPSTAANVISVGAYDDSYRAYADFFRPRFHPPDRPGKTGSGSSRGGYCHSQAGRRIRGSDGNLPFAAPLSQAAQPADAVGNITGKRPFLYGEKVKAYFTRGARHLPGYDVWPNERLGYGALCVRDSLPLGNS